MVCVDKMKRARADCRFVDLEAREADEEDEDEGEGEDMDHRASAQIQVYIIPSYSELLGGFLEDDTVVGTIPAGVSLSGDIDENSNREGWTGLVASIKERYAPGSGPTHRIAEGDLDIEPAIAAAVHNITCQPTDDDYPLWRVRCKVTPPILQHR
jgi:hypothetical protein